MVEFTRRSVLLAAGAVVTGGLVGVGRLAADPGAEGGAATDASARHLAAGDTEGVFPLVTYNDHDGSYRPTMPVNVRIDCADSGGLAAVESVLGRRSGWTQVVATIDDYWPFGAVDRPSAWDADAGRLVPPVRSYRLLGSPFGPIVGYHVYLWPVRTDGRVVGVAAAVHTDVGDARNHLGARYDDAAERFCAPFVDAGWTVEPAAFAFGVDPDQRSHWGATGDRWLRPPA